MNQVVPMRDELFHYSSEQKQSNPFQLLFTSPTMLQIAEQKRSVVAQLKWQSPLPINSLKQLLVSVGDKMITNIFIQWSSPQNDCIHHIWPLVIPHHPAHSLPAHKKSRSWLQAWMVSRVSCCSPSVLKAKPHYGRNSKGPMKEMSLGVTGRLMQHYSVRHNQNPR